MNLLYLDDNPETIDWFKKRSSFMDLELDRIFYADSLPDLTTLLNANEIDILLTDVVIDGDPILSTLHSIHDTFPDVAIIIYSCNTEFPIVQDSISLEISAYVKKPASLPQLEQAVAAAIRKRQRMQSVLTRVGMQEIAFWERFYSALLDGSIPSDIESINQVIRRRGHILHSSDLFLTILCDIGNWESILRTNSRVNLEYSLKTSAASILKLSGDIESIFCIPGQAKNYLIILKLLRPVDLAALKGKTAYLGHRMSTSFNASVNWIISEYIQIEALRSQVLTMENIARKISYRDSQTFFLQELVVSVEAEKSGSSISVSCLYYFLLGGSELPLREKTQSYFQQLKLQYPNNYYVCEEVCSEYVSMLYSVLKKKGISISKLIENEQFEEYRKRANWSVRDLYNFVSFSNSLMCDLINRHSDKPDKIESIRQYVDNNLSADLSRDTIAGTIGVNPEYLSRLFRKDTGLSLMEYIKRRRIVKARELLKDSEISVTQVAASCGFNSLPYFCKTFHQETGCTPKEYRQILLHQTDFPNHT